MGLVGAGNNWFFTSYDRDSESGLDYAVARYYDSRTGTFCSADPLAGDPSDPQSWNRYPYGRNDPIDMTDPSGKSFGDFVGSLIHGVMEGLAFAFGGPAGYAWAKANAYAYDGGDFKPVGGFGGMALGSSWSGTPIMPSGGLTNGIQRALGMPTMDDVGGPIANMNKEDDVISNALQAPNLADCARAFFGSKFSFTRSNMPHIDATQTLGGATAGKTIESMVPATGRATVLIDKGTFAMKANDPFLRDTYLHEAANATAIQKFTSQQTAAVFRQPTRQRRAELGPRGLGPSNAQHNHPWDPDIGQQFEKCLHGK
jgi:RHS repeat-associated protein